MRIDFFDWKFVDFSIIPKKTRNAYLKKPVQKMAMKTDVTLRRKTVVLRSKSQSYEPAELKKQVVENHKLLNVIGLRNELDGPRNFELSFLMNMIRKKCGLDFDNQALIKSKKICGHNLLAAFVMEC